MKVYMMWNTRLRYPGPRHTGDRQQVHSYGTARLLTGTKVLAINCKILVAPVCDQLLNTHMYLLLSTFTIGGSNELQREICGDTMLLYFLSRAGSLASEFCSKTSAPGFSETDSCFPHWHLPLNPPKPAPYKACAELLYSRECVTYSIWLPRKAWGEWTERPHWDCHRFTPDTSKEVGKFSQDFHPRGLPPLPLIYYRNDH